MRERLAHISSGLEVQLDQPDVLNRLRFDVIDARDVEEVVLVVIRQKAFHLLRIHAAVRLGDVNHRRVEIGKNVDGHACHGDHSAQNDGRNRDG